MRTLITLLAGLAAGATVAVFVSARVDALTRTEQHRQMPDVTAEAEPADA
jgi:hypothetical protein